jgi:hypothetical protein
VTELNPTFEVPHPAITAKLVFIVVVVLPAQDCPVNVLKPVFEFPQPDFGIGIVEI